jgi:hypothetical protein
MPGQRLVVHRLLAIHDVAYLYILAPELPRHPKTAPHTPYDALMNV